MTRYTISPKACRFCNGAGAILHPASTGRFCVCGHKSNQKKEENKRNYNSLLPPPMIASPAPGGGGWVVSAESPGTGPPIIHHPPIIWRQWSVAASPDCRDTPSHRVHRTARCLQRRPLGMWAGYTIEESTILMATSCQDTTLTNSGVAL